MPARVSVVSEPHRDDDVGTTPHTTITIRVAACRPRASVINYRTGPDRRRGKTAERACGKWKSRTHSALGVRRTATHLLTSTADYGHSAQATSASSANPICH